MCVHACATVHVGRAEPTCWSQLSLHHEADTQTLRLSSRHLYLLSHLTTSTLILFVAVPNDIFVLKSES